MLSCSPSSAPSGSWYLLFHSQHSQGYHWSSDLQAVVDNKQQIQLCITLLTYPVPVLRSYPQHPPDSFLTACVPVLPCQRMSQNLSPPWKSGPAIQRLLKKALSSSSTDWVNHHHNVILFSLSHPHPQALNQTVDIPLKTSLYPYFMSWQPCPLYLCFSWEVCIHIPPTPVMWAIPSCLHYANNGIVLWLRAELIPPACFPACTYLHTCTWDEHPSFTSPKIRLVPNTLCNLLSMHVPIAPLTMGHHVPSPPKALLTTLASLLA